MRLRHLLEDLLHVLPAPRAVEQLEGPDPRLLGTEQTCEPVLRLARALGPGEREERPVQRPGGVDPLRLLELGDRPVGRPRAEEAGEPREVSCRRNPRIGSLES